MRDVFSIEASILTDPRTGRPLVLPARTLNGMLPTYGVTNDLVGDFVLQGSFEGSSSVAGD